MMIAVYGITGKTGKTSVAEEMAGCFWGEGRKTILVDMDLKNGDVTQRLKLKKRPNIGTWLRDIYDRMEDEDYLEMTYSYDEFSHYIQYHSSGLPVLATNRREATADTPMVVSGVDVICRSLRESPFEVVVFDTNNTVRDYTLDLLFKVDVVVLVLDEFRFNVQDAELFLSFLKDEGFELKNFKVVFNRYPTFTEDNPDEICARLGLPLLGVLPYDPGFGKKMEDGTILSLQEGSEFGREMRKIVARLLSGN